jgi:hypothetical protein
LTMTSNYTTIPHNKGTKESRKIIRIAFHVVTTLSQFNTFNTK